MKNLLKRASTTIFVLTLVLSLGGSVNPLQAQATEQAKPDGPMAMHGHHRAPDPARQTALLTKRLGLTTEQAAQVEPILKSRQQQMEALRANTSNDPKVMHEQRLAIMTDTEQKLNAVLNEQQKQQFAAMKAQHEHSHHDGENTPAPPPAK